jgi:hypothetical protein
MIMTTLANPLKTVGMMRKEMFNKSFLLLCVVVLVLCAKVTFPSNDDEAYIIGLRYPTSYDLITYPNRGHIRAIGYKVRLLFPSKDIVKFYDVKLSNIGWSPFVQPYYSKDDRKWMQFIDCTIEGHPLVHQLYAQWVNKKHNIMVVLGIRYYSIYINKQENLYAREQKPNNDIQEVVLQIMPITIIPPKENEK